MIEAVTGYTSPDGASASDKCIDVTHWKRSARRRYLQPGAPLPDNVVRLFPERAPVDRTLEGFLMLAIVAAMGPNARARVWAQVESIFAATGDPIAARAAQLLEPMTWGR